MHKLTGAAEALRSWVAILCSRGIFSVGVQCSVPSRHVEQEAR